MDWPKSIKSVCAFCENNFVENRCYGTDYYYFCTLFKNPIGINPITGMKCFVTKNEHSVLNGYDYEASEYKHCMEINNDGNCDLFIRKNEEEIKKLKLSLGDNYGKSILEVKGDGIKVDAINFISTLNEKDRKQLMGETNE